MTEKETKPISIFPPTENDVQKAINMAGAEPENVLVQEFQIMQQKNPHLNQWINDHSDALTLKLDLEPGANFLQGALWSSLIIRLQQPQEQLLLSDSAFPIFVFGGAAEVYFILKRALGK